jgi:hypothetical protein
MRNELERFENEGGFIAPPRNDYADSDASINEDYEGHYERQYGWPGDGSGEDDLADFNANEAQDYSNE